MRGLVLGISILLLLCGAASARPRDQVMMNAYRCAGHAATRVWLDCYYGAAQPQRAALSLSPAPAAQIQLLDAPPGAGATQDETARDAVMGAAARCAGVAEDRAWLDCYYAAANPVRGVLGLALMAGPPPPGPMIAPPPPRPSAPVPHNDPGFVGRLLGASNFKVVSRMRDYRLSHDQAFVVTLENGQVWKQLDGDTAAHWSRDPSHYEVTITGGAFGSFNMAVKGSPERYKVHRTS